MANKIEIVFNKLPELIKKYPKAAENGIKATAFEGERMVKKSIADSPATGIAYGDHISSSAGNPPRIDSSNLVNNINVKQISRFAYEIRSGAAYSAELEFGTSKMAARPYMGPMAMQLQKEADDIMKDWLKGVI